VPAGWNQTSATCDNGDAPAAIHLGAGQTITCTFRNTQRGKLTVLKTVNGGPLASGQSFTFQVRQGATPTQSGSILESKVISSTTFVGLANGAVFDNGGNLYVPGPYQLCEIVMPGWQTTLGSFVPNSFLPPDGVAANPAVDNSILCINITIAANGNQTFTVDNTPPPGGRSLTIGFWKNWASCASSNGKQKPVLDNTLAAAVAATTNPPGGLVVSAQNIGGGWPNYAPTYYLVLGANDCTKAVSLLNKQDWSNGKKMSSDPLFNMTAQLVAAQLNYFAGSAKSGTTTTNVNRAVVLNGKYQFNGGTAGNGQGYVGKLSSADTSTANCLATQLDNYNNDRPVSSCP
jgi:hypothetical protein